MAATGCSSISLDPAPPIIHARFDPDAKVIPMPTDVLRDAAAGHLKLPADDPDITDAEREFYTWMNTLDGWSTSMSATIEFTGPVNTATFTADNLQVWKWNGVPKRVTDARVWFSADEKKLTIDPPRAGWDRGARYAVLLRGGVAGVEGKQGEKVECDAAFYFLRQTERLDTPEHERAFPGNTAAKRHDNAKKLEDLREDLSPFFDWFEREEHITRPDVAALWTFTVTSKVELAMDKSTQRMPIPIEILIDPTTGKVDLPPAPWDSDVEKEAKTRLRDYDGFATSANLLFEFTGPMDKATINSTNVKLYRFGGGAPQPVLADVTLMDDLVHVVVTPKALPLPEGTTYALVVTGGVRDADGNAVVAMPAGHFLKAHSVVFDGKSRVPAVADDDAHRIEDARVELAPLLDVIGRDDVIAAWPFTTMKIHDKLVADAQTAKRLGLPVDPENIEHKTPLEALADFALAISSLTRVGDVYYGTIKSAVYLDDSTRAWRTDGNYDLQDIPFTMTVPKNLPAGKPVPVVIFGHAICTERRFVLAIGDALAAKGFAAISIDFPYHGTRTHCFKGGPISVVNPTTGELVSMEPCESGYTCAENGKCVDAAGHGNHLAMWPVLNMPVASGAAFLEVEHIANTKDHFRQSLVDLGALERSLREGDWASVIGRPIDTSNIMYAGQSLGGIIGATFLGASPTIGRSVLNVPGSDLVALFKDSGWFGGQVDGFFTRQHIVKGSFEAERFLDVAHWFVDAVDPMNVATYTGDRPLLIQMALLDIIIPNYTTTLLSTLTGAPHRDYVAEHAFLVIPIEPEYLRGGSDLAAFLNGEALP
jgi:dienelactone hydrolase